MRSGWTQLSRGRVLGLAGMLLLTTAIATATGADTAGQLDNVVGPAGEHRVALLPSALPLRFRWTATVRRSGGEFVLLRSTAGARFAEVGRIAAERSGVFQQSDREPPASRAVYQLRHQTRDGQEQVIISVAVFFQQVAPPSVLPSLAGQQQLVSSRTHVAVPPGAATSPPSPRIERARLGDDEPSVPPPRAPAAELIGARASRSPSFV